VSDLFLFAALMFTYKMECSYFEFVVKE
jgi:hypothetical protein